LLASLTLAISGPTLADDEQDEHESLPTQVEDGEIRSLADLRRIVLSRVAGDIVSARIEQEQGLSLYEFRVLRADGRLVEVEIDARTGEILELEND
jgi:uncharacterized membrane protein YkoI